MKQLTITSKLTNRESDSFNLYLKDIYDLDVLTPAEELVLAEKAATGDKKAKDELVRRNLRFVVTVAKQLATQQVPLEDLINEGNIGLIIAADRFKPEMGWRFLSYAVWWIRKIMYEHISKYGKMVRLPANKINGLSKLDKKIHELEQKLGRPVDINEVIAEYGEDFVSDKIGFLNILNTYSMDSLDREIGGDDSNGHTTLADLISDETNSKPTDHLIVNANLKTEIGRIIETLKPREQIIITALYGLDGNSPMTLKEIGDTVGVTRESIRQIKEKILKNLKVKLKNSSIRSYN
jgi:RNA polymerase primary sigma factor